MAWADVWPVVLLGLAVLALGSVALARVLGRPRGRGTRAPLVAVPPEEVELEEGPVWACMRCGSLDVGPGAVSQGMLPGAGDAFAFVCRRCHARGPPLEFESATAYRQFVKGLHEDRSAATGAAEK